MNFAWQKNVCSFIRIFDLREILSFTDHYFVASIESNACNSIEVATFYQMNLVLQCRNSIEMNDKITLDAKFYAAHKESSFARGWYATKPFQVIPICNQSLMSYIDRTRHRQK